MMDPLLLVENVGKYYLSPDGEGRLPALDGVSLDVSRGEIVALLGPSGCGKTTLLNLIAGFDHPQEGRISFGGEEVKGPSSARGVVFQEAALFPWLTVRENVSFGMRLRKEKKESIVTRANRFIDLVGLRGFEDYYPAHLSGGMQQRTALARVLVMEPEALLMDEPFAALDAQTRLQMQQLLLSLSQKIHPAIIFVTHDIEEALFLSDRILLLTPRPGRINREIQVPFSGNRTPALFKERAFMELKGEILEGMGWSFSQDPRALP